MKERSGEKENGEKKSVEENGCEVKEV